jgi:hypothetical protein
MTNISTPMLDKARTGFLGAFGEIVEALQELHKLDGGHTAPSLAVDISTIKCATISFGPHCKSYRAEAVEDALTDAHDAILARIAAEEPRLTQAAA